MMEENKTEETNLPLKPQEIVEENIRSFKELSERVFMNIQDSETGECVVEISGYDLAFNINLERINSIEDVEGVLTGISDMFRDLIMEKLLAKDKQ